MMIALWACTTIGLLLLAVLGWQLLRIIQEGRREDVDPDIIELLRRRDR